MRYMKVIFFSMVLLIAKIDGSWKKCGVEWW